MVSVLLLLVLWLCVTGILIVGIALLPTAQSRIVANLATVGVVVILLAIARRMTPGNGRAILFSEEGSCKARLPIGLFVTQFVVLFVIKACGAVAPNHFVLASGVGFALAACSIVTLCLSRGKVIELRGLYNLALLFAEIALLGASLSTMALVVVGVFNGAAYCFFAVFCFTVYATICLRHHANPIRVFGIAIACECFASLAGIQFCSTAMAIEVPRGTILVFLSALLAVTFLFLFSDAQYRSDWGTRRARPSVDSVMQYYYTLPDVCTALAKQYGLSKREETVLQLLAQKKSGPDIAAELFVSVPTVKSHTQNIYRKLEVHSRAELFALLNVEAPAPGEEREAPELFAL